ncbi:hypothetical protein [Mesohalobacter salilacus]|uniref:hypothetical protein n=1 Tax=Mesohalobacter salilacus TaxID=2491711 RepID=UPI0026D7DAF5
MVADNLVGILITKADDQPVKNIKELRQILDNRDPYEPLSLTFTAPNGESKTYVFR